MGKRNDCNGYAAIGEVRVPFNAVDKVLDAPHSDIKSARTTPTVAHLCIHAGGHVQNEADIVVGLNLLAFGHAAAVARSHGSGNAVAAGNGDGVIAIIDGSSALVRCLLRHLQRNAHRVCSSVAVGVFRLKHKLKLVG